jgi:hypothetical protein
MNGALDEQLGAIVQDTNERLWMSYGGSIGSLVESRVAGLVFPRYNRSTSNEVRVSEREAAFAMAMNLERRGLRYAVEVPTKFDYQFKGIRGRRSALIDLGVYGPLGDALDPCLSVEFKKGGVTTNARDNGRFEKDVEKILCEPADALWFHVLERVRSNTISGVLAVIGASIVGVSTNTDRRITSKTIQFNVCVLDAPLAISKALRFDPETAAGGELSNFFKFHYSVSNQKISVLDANGWAVCTPASIEKQRESSCSSKV